MPAEVYYHSAFRKSSDVSEYFKDYLSMSTTEMDLLSDFILSVQDGDSLKGKNKPSWTDSNGNEISSVSLKYYKKCKLWHYHLGPFSPHIIRTQSKIRIINILGHTSSCIIHYKWYDPNQKILLIVAFSPVHNPFPSPDDRKNPLSRRCGLIKKEDMIPPFSF